MPGATAGGDGRITVKVKGQDGEEVFFRAKRHWKLRRVMDAYGSHKSLAASSFVFLFDGNRIDSEQTLEELEIKEGDTIDAMLPQNGG